jgi:peptide/nickel transport system substrate-binding protein
VGRYIRWQAIITLTGIAMIMAFLSFLAFSRTTVSIPDVGGVYKEALAGTPQFINPLLMQYNQVDQDLSALIFNGLTRFNSQGDLAPDLAERWEVSEDGLTYLFKLRSNVRWQDGQPFTADDVIFTVGLMQDPEFPGVPYLSDLWQSVMVEKLDRYTVRFILPEPFPAFTDFTSIGILPQHLLAEMPARDLLNHPFNLQPVGTGPFRLVEVNSKLARLTANRFYTGPKPRLAGLELHFYPNYQAAISAYREGEVQGISFIPPHLIPAVQDIESLNLYSAQLSGYDLVYLNLQTPEQLPFFQDVKVRQAMLSALDRQAIIDQALYGQGLPATGPILPWNWAYNADQTIRGYEPMTATALLDESGWLDQDGDGIREKEGIPFAFTLLSSDDPDKIKVAEVVSQQWQQVGISATLEIVGAGLGERLIQHNFQAALAEVLLAGDPDPYPFWHQTQIEGGQNYAGWNHSDASMLLETARTMTDRGRRNDLYFEFQRIFAEEVPSLILFHPVYTYGVSQEINDVQLMPMINASDRFNSVSHWYILTRQVIYSETGF